jgi:hypothetical protein
MKYLCLIYYDEKKLSALSGSAYDSFVAEMLGYDEELRQSGHAHSAASLTHVETATTVRVGYGRVSVTDGPFAETREQLGGFILIEARDLNEAIRVASKMPSARMGCIEVRPIKDCGLPFEITTDSTALPAP